MVEFVKNVEDNKPAPTDEKAPVIPPKAEDTDADASTEGTEEGKGSSEGSKSPELSPTEQLAQSQGWVPLSEWQGDPKDHRSAKEFIDRGELLTRIRTQNQELQSVKNIVAQLSDHNKRVFQAGYENALKELRVAKAAAIENQDGKALVLIEEQIDDTRDKLAAAKAAPSVAQMPRGQQGASPEFQTFLQRNPAYLSEATFRHWSHGMAIEFARVNPTAQEGDVYEFVEREAKKVWPDKYGLARKAPPSPDGESRRNTSGGGQSKTTGASFEALMGTLPEDQVRVARDMVKRGYMTKEKFVEDYNEIEGR